ncbi:hypothetical protein GS8_699 [Geobacillus stearothermophilus]|uniref:Uncharacterized protein n=1 Tax=Geobacillus stearothermophilus TaxID=1422 RepID=A0A150N415_GEOSE|nr:hypothetical protein GS8_699 [Geobacillus stearothermophilus]KYD31435.1 hypothetical protein B4114_2801 [Geobacillus stearothermophilus]
MRKDFVFSRRYTINHAPNEVNEKVFDHDNGPCRIDKGHFMCFMA